MSDILQTILQVKADENRLLKKKFSRSALQDEIAAQVPVRGFSMALAKKSENGAAVIAEFKRASPSKGIIREGAEPADIAEQYQRAGAACMSVLTDVNFFKGSDADLTAAKSACDLPFIRKDFLIDPMQVLHSRALGADCVLLIAAALTSSQLNDLYSCAIEQKLDVLVEVHNQQELDLVLAANLPQNVLLGINNRNLRTFQTSLETTIELLENVPKNWDVVTESGINTPEDMRKMLDAGVRRFLIGESLMRQPSPHDALAILLDAAC